MLLLRTLEDVVAGIEKNVIFLLPPGSAKSTYTSVLFPPWYLRQKVSATILACSYSLTLIESFGKRCRNLIDQHESVLGYSLSKHSQAAGDWETSLGGRYFCAGVGAGIAGHRADLAFIDDYLGSEEDADSKVVRDKQWAWYNNDFWPRLKPEAAQVIVANRRHEEDLVGLLLAKDPSKWKVIKVPFFAVANDPLGRAVDMRLWPEWFTERQAAEIRQLPSRTISGLYQQEPTPDEGDYFKREWLVGYQPSELPKEDELRIYVASDFAISEEATRDATCMMPFGIDHKGEIWILPDIRWGRYGPKELIGEFIGIVRRRKPQTWFAERGQISKSLGPFIKDQMAEENVYAYIEELVPTKAKDVRARSIQGIMSLKRVHFPRYTSWWPQAEHELLTFPGGKNDDFVDTLAWVGLAVEKYIRGRQTTTEEEINVNLFKPLTLAWVKESDKAKRRDMEVRYGGR